MRSNHASPWRVIYIARGEQQAQQIEALLEQAGFMIDRRQALPEGPPLSDGTGTVRGGRLPARRHRYAGLTAS